VTPPPAGPAGSESARDSSTGVSPRSGRRLDVRRLYAAIVFVPLFYGLVRYFPPQGFFGLVLAAGVIAVAEFYRLHFRETERRDAIVLGTVATGMLFVSLQWPAVLSERLALLFTVIVALVSRLTAGNLTRTLTDAAVIVTGVLYVGFLLGHVLLTRALPGGEFLIFFLVLVTWAGDTGAYYAGMLLGRTKLAPHISPNKTVEGLVGGLVLATLAAALGRAWFLPSFTLSDVVICGVILTLVGVVGDLAESALKRSAGVKDSGGIIPAHGGMLDRLDSLLFTAPTFYYYVTLVKG
jgi:phosphatidate cytidylyltransferase